MRPGRKTCCNVLALMLGACAPSLDSDRDYCAVMKAPAGLDYRSHPKAARFQSLLDDALAAGVPGAALLVDDPQGLWIGAGGQCDIGRDVPMGPFARSRVASVTKPFIAAATLLLAEEGLLDLDDPIGMHLDQRRAAKVVNSDLITVRQLLNHRSGLPDEPMTVSAPFALDVFVDDPYQEVSREAYLDALEDQPALFAPGQDFSYSNFGYALLGLILEHASGQTEWAAVTSHVLAPLGLTDTLYAPEPSTPKGLARGYADLYGDGRLTDTSDWDALHPLNAEGGIVSTVYDLSRFFDALLNGSLLSAASKAELLDCLPVTSVEGLDSYGMGINCTAVDDKPAFRHAGLVIGYVTTLHAYPEQGAIVALIANASFGDAQAAAAELVEERLPPLLE